MRYFALIDKNGVCTNALGTPDGTVRLLPSDGEVVVEIGADEFSGAVGGTYAADVFTSRAAPSHDVSSPDCEVVASTWITLETARSLFTDAEKINIYTAAKTEVAVQVWLDDLHAVHNQMVNKSDPRFIEGVNAMEFGGLIGAGRAEEILA